MITINNIVNAPIEKVWEYWTNPIHVKNWNFAASDWHCPDAINNLQVGGEFHYTMAAKDNSFSFDYWGTYQKIETNKQLDFVLGDGRKVVVSFETAENGTIVTEHFEPEQQNPPERQQTGWQMILDNFKTYVEHGA